MRGRWSALLLGLVVACGGPERRSDDAHVSREALRDHMKQHITSANDVRDWIIAGDLQRARESATWLAVHESPHAIPREWIPIETDLRVAAGDLAEASDLASAAHSVSALARTCGTCHVANGVELQLGATAPALEEDYAGRVMSQHEWAAERMWQGLYVPSARAWREGSEAMRSRLHPSDIIDLSLGNERFVELESEVHSIAARARAAAGMTERTALYADLIGTCSRCHALIAEL